MSHPPVEEEAQFDCPPRSEVQSADREKLLSLRLRRKQTMLPRPKFTVESVLHWAPFAMMQPFEPLMVRDRFREWTSSERLLLTFACVALSLILIISIASFYHNTCSPLNVRLLTFPKRINLNILPRTVECSRSDGSSELKLVIVLKTRIEEVEQRRAIRETWASESRWPVVFAVGKSASSAQNLNINEESSSYGDILRADFVDSYFNLSLKSLSILQWMADRCAQMDFYVQADSDMLLSPRALERLVATRRGRAKEIYGRVLKRQFVHHWDKWAVNPNSYPYKRYPDFCSGRFLLMTKDVPGALLAAHDQRVSRLRHSGYISVDDAYFTGIISAEAGVKRINQPNVLSLPQGGASIDETDLCGILAIGEFKNQELMREAWNRLKAAYNGCAATYKPSP